LEREQKGGKKSRKQRSEERGGRKKERERDIKH